MLNILKAAETALIEPISAEYAASILNSLREIRDHLDARDRSAALEHRDVYGGQAHPHAERDHRWQCEAILVRSFTDRFAARAAELGASA